MFLPVIELLLLELQDTFLLYVAMHFEDCTDKGKFQNFLACVLEDQRET